MFHAELEHPRQLRPRVRCHPPRDELPAAHLRAPLEQREGRLERLREHRRAEPVPEPEHEVRPQLVHPR